MTLEKGEGIPNASYFGRRVDAAGEYSCKRREKSLKPLRLTHHLGEEVDRLRLDSTTRPSLNGGESLNTGVSFVCRSRKNS